MKSDRVIAPVTSIVREARPRLWWYLLAAGMPVVSALTLWAVLPARYRVNESTDYAVFYEPVARALLAGRGLVTPDGAPALLYPPGHPLIIAAILGVAAQAHIPEPFAIDCFLLGCLAASSLVLFSVSRRVWGTAGGLATSAGWSTYPLILWAAKQPNSEVPFFPLLIGAAAVTFSILQYQGGRGRGLAAGILTGLAMLVRPMAILLGPVLCATIIWRARPAPLRVRISCCVALLVGVALVIAPWEVWARRQSGHWILLSTNGVPSMKDGLTFAVDPRPYRRGISVPEDVRQLMLRINAQRMRTTGDIVRAIAREAVNHPAAPVKLMGIKLARAWYGTDSQRMETPLMAVQIIYLSVLLAAAVLAWRSGGARRDLTVLVCGILLYFWLMNLSSLPLARYTTPAAGLMFLVFPAIVASIRNGARALDRDETSITLDRG